MTRDRIYAEPADAVATFTFDEKVARVFPDMIKRSVPGYSTVIAMTGVLAAEYAQPDSVCYDLGCSLGEGSFAMLQKLHADNATVIGVDNSEAMLDKCRQTLNAAESDTGFELVCADILDIQFKPSSVIVMNYTLQFIALEQRETLLKRLFDSLLPGGVLLLSEKVRFQDEILNREMIELHHAFKKANGYSDLEISQKRTALENVLVPETPEVHHQRLKSVGFNRVDTWFQCFNFMSLIAFKA
jgi:tRNA (cmo5U34)-methyltransferase